MVLIGIGLRVAKSLDEEVAEHGLAKGLGPECKLAGRAGGQVNDTVFGSSQFEQTASVRHDIQDQEFLSSRALLQRVQYGLEGKKRLGGEGVGIIGQDLHGSISID